MTTQLSIEEIQEALIAKLKANVNISARVGTDIREMQYQGDGFVYPNLRVRVDSLQPLQSYQCSHYRFDCRMQVFSESDNSLESNQIAGIIFKELSNKQFTASNIALSLRLLNLLSAIRVNVRTWRAEILWSGIASKIA